MTKNTVSFEELLQAYRVEAEGFGAIVESGRGAEILAGFSNYPDYIRQQTADIKTKKMIKRLSKGTGIIYASNPEQALRDIFYNAHVAACCELFMGWDLPVQSLNRKNTLRCAEKALELYRDQPEDKRYEISKRIHNSDATRTMQILRFFGLLTASSTGFRQLSFAAGSGTRDIDGLHGMPVIERKQGTMAVSVPLHDSISFSKKILKPDNVVLVDNDSDIHEHYADLSKNNREWLLALDKDADKAMACLPEILTKRQWGLRNLIAGIRIDHRMIPDVALFMSQLTPLLDTSADFIISIGAGHSVDEFRGRLKVVSALFDYLKQCGLEPVRIILHGQGSIEEQRNSPSFGLSYYSTYEILYCKLKRKKLL